MKYQFCGVFLFKQRLYLSLEEKVGGPRCMILPPKELPADIDAKSLGVEVLAALDAFREAVSPLRPEEWESLNNQLLKLFGEKSIAAFERKKREVTVRREVESGEICLFGERDEKVTTADPERVGEVIRELLALQP